MAGLVTAKLKSRTGGRPKGLSEDAEKTARVTELLYKEGYSIKRIAEELKLSCTTAYKYLDERGVMLDL